VGAAQFFFTAVNTTTTGLDVFISYSLPGYKPLYKICSGNVNNMNIDKYFTNDKLAKDEKIPISAYVVIASCLPQRRERKDPGYELFHEEVFASLHVNRFGKWADPIFFINGDAVADDIGSG
jgi:hypothetical protein